MWQIYSDGPYLTFYRPTADGVEIWRVLHGARDIESLFGEGR
ncbi:MAG: type II toxin-antitoxin system RelE/ParE family toxin [Planctomycetes bacterium]|nr:type II toxin-antitoxin system RelE/ParE family toxin [Planctomycetota bacterium]